MKTGSMIVGVLGLLMGCTASPPPQVVRPIIAVFPALQKEINAETKDNGLPWHNEESKYDVRLTGQLVAEEPLVETIQGDHSFTLYRFTYAVVQVLEGDFPQKEVTFLYELAWPTPESGIDLKAFWPFPKTLTFKMRKNAPRFIIVSIERGTEPASAGDSSTRATRVSEPPEM